MKRILWIVLLACVIGGVQRASAQYYTWGSDAPMKWSKIRTPDVKMIYPDTASELGRRTLFYIRSVQPSIAYGFSKGPMRIPFVMHPENFRANGLVMYLPKRVEFLTSPEIDGYSMPWTKQLVAHEYRHAVQYNNLNCGLIRIASYILGQQGSTLGLLYLPLWVMEGDATMSETEMSTFGRGRQPSFTMSFRALGNIGKDRGNMDRWFCGSYLSHVPDQYQLGYQLCSYTYDRFGENVWNKAARFGGRNPYMIVTSTITLHKFYKTSVRKLFHETFDSLASYWDSIPKTGDSARPLVSLPEKNHTTYRHPLPLNDTTLLAFKSDLARPDRLMRIDTRTGEEQLISYLGAVSTRPTISNGRLWWTEFRRSKLFEQRVNSQLCYLDLADGRPRTASGADKRRALYPTASSGALAWVDYNPSGRYTVVVEREGAPQERFEVPFGSEVHGLAWDDVTVAYYVIITDEEGMHLSRIDAEGLHRVTQSAFITLSDLRAADGKLYYGSIQSGKDEAHCYDLTARHEYRITSSDYGTFDPAPGADGELYVTTYDRQGYRVAAQRVTDSALIAVAPSRLPVDLVNPPRKRWNVINLDTLRFTETDSVQQEKRYPRRRYHKGLHLINVHSWMPVAMNPFELVDEHIVKMNFGGTLVAQNLLSNTEAFASYGWSSVEGSLVNLGVRYFGLGVRLQLDASFGGNQIFYAPSEPDATTGEPTYDKRPASDKYYSVGLSATLPLYFQRGYHTRQLSLSSSWNYSNGMVADLGKLTWINGAITNFERIGFKKGLHKLAFGVGYSDYVRQAHRDFAPRFGYSTSVSYTFNPANRHFSNLISLYGQLYLPGFAPHNSVVLAATYQTSIGGYKYPSGYMPLTYRSTRLIPHGFTSADIQSNDYVALSANYRLPVWYPEGGIESVIYIPRVRVGVGGEYARFRQLHPSGMAWKQLWAVGGEVTIDFNILSQPASGTSSLTVSVYRPSAGGVWWGVSVGLPF